MRFHSFLKDSWILLLNILKNLHVTTNYTFIKWHSLTSLQINCNSEIHKFCECHYLSNGLQNLNSSLINLSLTSQYLAKYLFCWFPVHLLLMYIPLFLWLLSPHQTSVYHIPTDITDMFVSNNTNNAYKLLHMAINVKVPSLTQGFVFCAQH